MKYSFGKSGQYYYKINQKNGKKTRISKEEYNLSKLNNTNKKPLDTLFSKLKHNHDNIIEIGRGGAGVVFLDKQYPTSVFKFSQKSETCRIWGKEASIYKILNTFDMDTKLCNILKMKDYVFDDATCAMELTRAYNPKGDDTHYTIHPQFQYPELDYFNKSRGHFLGINNLVKEGIFTNENISEYIKDLGKIMARLHYKAKNDGYDIELFISKPKGRKTKIFIGDFDLSQFYKETPDIGRLAWSLGAVPYFPMEGELYDVFSKHYIQEASKYNMKSVAIQVLQQYTE